MSGFVIFGAKILHEKHVDEIDSSERLVVNKKSLDDHCKYFRKKIALFLKF